MNKGFTKSKKYMGPKVGKNAITMLAGFRTKRSEGFMKEHRYKTISGRQHDGSDVEIDVCSHCDYADGHDEKCLIPEVERLEEKLEDALTVGRRLHVATEKLLAWMNGNGLSDQHFDEKPVDFQELNRALKDHAAILD